MPGIIECDGEHLLLTALHTPDASEEQRPTDFLPGEHYIFVKAGRVGSVSDEIKASDTVTRRRPVGYNESDAKLEVVAAIKSILRTAGVARTQVVLNRAISRIPN